MWFQAAMATSLDVRTYVMMAGSGDLDTVSLELVDLQFQHSWNKSDLEPFLGKKSYCYPSPV